MSKPTAGTHLPASGRVSLTAQQKGGPQPHSGGPANNNNSSNTNSNIISNNNSNNNNSTTSSSTSSPIPSTALVKNLKSFLSQPVRLTLEGGKQHVGLLWAVDTGMSAVVLEIPKSATTAIPFSDTEEYPSTAAAYPTSTLSSLKVAAQGGDASGSRTNFQILKLQRIVKAEKLQGPQASALERAKMTSITRDVNVAAAEARERAATAEALKRAAKIGVGVSPLGQSVFDALNKTLPCRWADRHIIVMDEIVISPDKYDAATVPQYQLATLQALAEGKDVAGVPEDARAKATRWQRVSKVLDGERKKILAKAPST